MSDDRRAEIGRQLKRGLKEVSAICEHGRDRWRMSIPAQPDRDSDLILSAALQAGREALAEVERLRAEVEQWRATFGESALRDGLARMTRAEAENGRLRSQLARHLTAWRSARSRAAVRTSMAAFWRGRAKTYEAAVERLNARLAESDGLLLDAHGDLCEALGIRYVTLAEAVEHAAAVRVERDRFRSQRDMYRTAWWSARIRAAIFREHAGEIEGRVDAAFDAADAAGTSLDAMTVTELTDLVMDAVRRDDDPPA